MKLEKRCKFCKELFKKKSDYSFNTWKGIKYCSIKCYGLSSSKRRKGKKLKGKELKKWQDILDKSNRNRVREKHWHWKGGKYIGGGYIYVFNPEHPNTNSSKTHVLEHRLVMSKYLGRKLESNELVHHINEDKADNRIENLALTTRSEHPKIHFTGKPNHLR